MQSGGNLSFHPYPLLAPPHDFDFTFAQKYRRENFHCKTLCRNYMNERIKELAIESKLIAPEYNGFDHTRLSISQQRFADLIVQECAEQSMSIGRYNTPGGNTPDLAIAIAVGLKKHFAVEEPKGWICPKCNADRTKIACPLGFGATVDGRCPMTVEAQ
jgi:hypothetical protein